MNRLSLDKHLLILNMLVEGSSMRAISRVVAVSINTVCKMLADAGSVCAKYHDEMVRNVAVRRVECDDVWAGQACANENGESFPWLSKGMGEPSTSQR